MSESSPESAEKTTEINIKRDTVVGMQIRINTKSGDQYLFQIVDPAECKAMVVRNGEQIGECVVDEVFRLGNAIFYKRIFWTNDVDDIKVENAKWKKFPFFS